MDLLHDDTQLVVVDTGKSCLGNEQGMRVTIGLIIIHVELRVSDKESLYPYDTDRHSSQSCHTAPSGMRPA